MTDHDLWQHLEAEFARVLGEVPKPKGPDGVQRWADTDEPVERVDGLPQSGQYADVGSGSPMKSPEA